MATLLDDKRVVLAVAGGEQAVANVLEMAPHALEHLAGAGANLVESGVAETVFHVVQDGLGATVGSTVSSALEHANPLEHLAHQAGDMLHGAQHAAEQVSHMGDGFDVHAAHGAHFPWVSLVISTVREGSRWADHKVSAERAAAHVAIDVGSRFAGAKAGALLGTAVAPGIGTAVGAVLGAIGGGMLGRELKHVPLRQAESAYDEAAAQMRVSVDASARQVVVTVHAVATQAQSDLDACRGATPFPSTRLDAADLQALVEQMVDSMTWAHTRAREDAMVIRDAALAGIPSAGLLHRAFLADATAQSRTRVEAAWQEVDDELSRLQARADELRRAPVLEALDEIAKTPTVADEQVEALIGRFSHTIDGQLQHRGKALSRWTVTISTAYARAVRRTMEIVQVQVTRHHAEQQQWENKLAEHLGAVEHHRRALGLA